MITTDNKWKQFIFGIDLTPKERKEFDYMSDEEIDYNYFIRYRKCVYSLSDFMTTKHFPGWDGYRGDSFFSGVVIKLSNDCESYKIGTYIS